MSGRKRPKSSAVGVYDFALSIHNARKVRQLRNRVDSIGASITAGNQATLSAVHRVGELQVATMHGLVRLQEQLNDLSKSSWQILDFLVQIDRREEILGDLKLFLINIEEEVSNIQETAKEYPIYATLMAENLKILLDEKDVSLEQFKRMPSTSDIKWAKNVIESVPKLYESLLSKLREL